jgi:hypothetical protein
LYSHTLSLMEVVTPTVGLVGKSSAIFTFSP